MVEQLRLRKTLALKVHQIVQLKKCANIFYHFMWNKKSYD